MILQKIFKKLRKIIVRSLARLNSVKIIYGKFEKKILGKNGKISDKMIIRIVQKKFELFYGKI